MAFFDRLDWMKWVEDHQQYRGDLTKTPTEKQMGMLSKFNVPSSLYPLFTRDLASELIGQRIEQTKAYYAHKQQSKRLEAERKLGDLQADHDVKLQRESAARAAAARKAQEKRAKIQLDPTTGLIGSPSQTEWANRIKTSLTPYLRKLKATAVPYSHMAEVIDFALKIDDARFWIARKRADMDPKELEKLIADVELRMALSALPQPEQKMKSRVVNWAEADDDLIDRG